MGIVRMRPGMSIVWHEAFAPGGRWWIAKNSTQRHNHPAGAWAERHPSSIFGCADEPVRRRHRLPKTSFPKDDAARSWRRSRHWPAAFGQERRHDMELPHATGRTALMLDARHPAQEISHRFDDCRLRRRHSQHRSGGSQAHFLPCRRQQAVVPDALECGRQEVLQKAPDELGARQADRPLLATRRIGADPGTPHRRLRSRRSARSRSRLGACSGRDTPALVLVRPAVVWHRPPSRDRKDATSSGASQGPPASARRRARRRVRR